MDQPQKICFVVMGFGKKTDFESGRTLDLDATYEAIIKPAALESKLRCIRADEVMHSGIIDSEMYEMLLGADLVIADISTGNPNAIYELGVRHALRPNSTIIMKESEGRLYFDLDHVSTFKYKHLGDDIGCREAIRAVRALKLLIDSVLSARRPDSPVYTYLPKLRRPTLSDEAFAAMVDELEEDQERLSKFMKVAAFASDESDHVEAAKALREADLMKPGDPYITQQLALATYKSEVPSKMDALAEGLRIISSLDPENSNDPETRGIAGAMHKRIWLLNHRVEHLDAAITHYRRGYEFRRDYYNGENLALCYDLRSTVHNDEKEVVFDQMSAFKIRREILENLEEATLDATFGDRSDQKWVFATLSNCSYALNQMKEAKAYESKFREFDPSAWELATFEQSRNLITPLHGN